MSRISELFDKRKEMDEAKEYLHDISKASTHSTVSKPVSKSDLITTPSTAAKITTTDDLTLPNLGFINMYAFSKEKDTVLPKIKRLVTAEEFEILMAANHLSSNSIISKYIEILTRLQLAGVFDDNPEVDED